MSKRLNGSGSSYKVKLEAALDAEKELVKSFAEKQSRLRQDRAFLSRIRSLVDHLGTLGQRFLTEEGEASLAAQPDRTLPDPLSGYAETEASLLTSGVAISLMLDKIANQQRIITTLSEALVDEKMSLPLGHAGGLDPVNLAEWMDKISVLRGEIQEDEIPPPINGGTSSQVALTAVGDGAMTFPVAKRPYIR